MHTVISPAKLNLALHVLGRQADVYHVLDSIVTSADLGADNDQITLNPSDAWALTVSGPASADVPSDGRNLLLKAAHAASALYPDAPRFALHLHKSLPHGAGLGGGSMNAASFLFALAGFWQLNPITAWPLGMLIALGADIPACYALQQHGWLRMRGIGEQIEAIAPLTTAPLYAVLTHPGQGLSTPDVFRATELSDYSTTFAELPSAAGAADFCQWLKTRSRNDLQRPASRILKAVDVQLQLIGQSDGCLLSRMSGSGSACFGLFDSAVSPQNAVAQIAANQPHWWVRACELGRSAAMLALHPSISSDAP